MAESGGDRRRAAAHGERWRRSPERQGSGAKRERGKDDGEMLTGVRPARGGDGERRRGMTGGRRRTADGLRNHLANKMRVVRGREENGRGRRRRSKAAAMAVLTGAQGGEGSGGGFRQRRGGRDDPHECRGSARRLAATGAVAAAAERRATVLGRWRAWERVVAKRKREKRRRGRFI
uniref:Retrotransposon protein, putative, Ty3-gypsy subclass n=1 Tax=Oryza sativa subsp. japonica TaxID=39947 RepID=Q69KS6_ORYSJ|nr:hypothetical protein [Oryza sativa Japonica Group]